MLVLKRGRVIPIELSRELHLANLQGHIGNRALLVKHTETWVERHAIEHDARRTNDTNANGDRPARETPGDHERQTQNSGGTLPANSQSETKTTEAKRGR